MTRKCHECGETKPVAADHEAKLTVGGRTYRATFPATRCASCGDVTFEGLYMQAFELGIAAHVAQVGARSGEEFAFMRKTLGFSATELAELLEVARETVSRWERGHQPLERRAVAILSELVADYLEGKTRTLDRLRMLREPPKLAKTVPIEIDARLRRAAAR